VIRLRASHTHLYPGARLCLVDGSSVPRKGAKAEIEFADRIVAKASIAAAGAGKPIEFDVESYRTRSGSTIEVKRWLAVSDDEREARAYRVVRRLTEGD
jgi:hypothetical protein